MGDSTPNKAQVSAGKYFAVLLRSDGRAVPSALQGEPGRIPPLENGVRYTQVSVGWYHIVLLRSDGSAVASGSNHCGQCDIPPLEDARGPRSAGHEGL